MYYIYNYQKKEKTFNDYESKTDTSEPEVDKEIIDITGYYAKDNEYINPNTKQVEGKRLNV